MRVAVIGSGVGGIGAAWALSREHEVHLFEAEGRVGGHSRTLEADVYGDAIEVDTGFIVYNERNYPNLVRFFETLGVETTESDMSFAVSADAGNIEYAGRAGGFFGRPRAFLDLRMWQIAWGIARFRGEQKRLERGLVPHDMTISEYLEFRKYPKAFVQHYLVPLASAVWSSSITDAELMPARTFLGFLRNHGLIRLSDRPQWRTVVGGSRSYVDRAVKEITSVHTSRAVRSVQRHAESVTVTDEFGVTESFDHVVVATHADAALRILGSEATVDERQILGAFRYDANEVVLHTDPSAMPGGSRVWSSWNVVERPDDDGTEPASVTYWMNRLQPLATSAGVFVTLNPVMPIDPDTIIDRWVAHHPQFDLGTDVAQARMSSIQGRDRIWFAGAHLGYGFHEDGLQSGLTVAASLGSPAPWHRAVTPASPASVHAASDHGLVRV